MDSLQYTWGCCNKGNLDEKEQFLTCKSCNGSYHLLCLFLPDISTDSDAYCDWICPECSSMIPKTSKKDCTPIRNVSTIRGNKRMALNSPPESAAVTSEDIRVIVEDVFKKEFSIMMKQLNSIIVNVINKELEPIKKDVRDLTESLNFHTQQFDKLQQENVTLKSDIKGLKKENDELKSSITDVNQRLGYLEQQARSNNLELQCLPENRQENLITIVKQLGSVVGCALEDNDIVRCTRVAKLQSNNPRPRSVVIQLATPRTRDQLLASVINHNKKTPDNKLNSADLGIAGKKTPIFIVEHLSPTLKALHAATRIKAKEKGYKFVWVRGGRIYIKKNEEAEHVIIKNKDMLNKIV